MKKTLGTSITVLYFDNSFGASDFQIIFSYTIPLSLKKGKKDVFAKKGRRMDHSQTKRGKQIEGRGLKHTYLSCVLQSSFLSNYVTNADCSILIFCCDFLEIKIYETLPQVCMNVLQYMYVLYEIEQLNERYKKKGQIDSHMERQIDSKRERERF